MLTSISVLNLFEIFVTLFFFHCSSLIHPLKTFVPAGRWRIRGSMISISGEFTYYRRGEHIHQHHSSDVRITRATEKKAPSPMFTGKDQTGAEWESLFVLCLHTHHMNKYIVSSCVQHIKYIEMAIIILLRVASRKCARDS